ncbi:Alpha/Beta hydrolase protein [Chaetomium fimeti]|uniref:Carboxylic ester hydrolase n=1 Tax=Chaetomium fimeti TaxID=1854472 RepID=A0AAE0LW92_9PEZI|nr:Alpha/Beta hydrolase protein [Chaetomium fimeti]
MRYAAPPLDNLRWRAPVEPVPTPTGTVEEAMTYGPICLGNDLAYPVQGQSEDCLFVNVWAPTNATERSKLPVWVFIQGGGYGHNANSNWDGNEVVQRSGHKIVMVNFNYRVGLWGFLASERVRKDGALNAGLLDQRMLMKWVKTHIASFGGDPDHVVIHGASAGAGSVATHMVAYGGRNDNLFVGAMSQANFFPAQPFVEELEYQFDRVVSQTGCDKLDPSQQIGCLRGKDVAVLQAANHAQAFPGRPGPPMPLFYWTPCVDGDFLRDLPYRLFERGQFINVPVVFGTSTDEGSVFVSNAATPDDVSLFFLNNYPPPHRQRHHLHPRPAFGEATFICPSLNVLTHLHRHSHPQHHHPNTPSQPTNQTTTLEHRKSSIYTYRYNVHDASNLAAGLGVPHIFDSAAIFGPDNVGGGYLARASYKTYNAAVVPLVMGYWISFVRALDPNVFRVPGAPRWEVWGGGGVGDRDGEGDGGRLVVETEGARMERVGGGERGRCAFWEGLGGGRMRQR